MSSRGPRRAFTLVELLVVIGIIALLISVLLPTLGKARESGRRIACLSNLRQLSVAILMYEQQYKRLPGPLIPAVLDYDTVNANPVIISAYYQARELSNKDMLMKYVNNSKQVFFCPSSFEMRQTAVPVSGSSPYKGVVLGYTYKVNNQSTTLPSYFFGSHTSTKSAEEQEPKRMASIRAASNVPTDVVVKSKSQIWMISDLDGRNFSTATSDDFGISDSALAVDRRQYQPVHKSGKTGRNYCFFDGHAEFLLVDFWPVRP